jgi:hypothetical protein
VKKKREKIREKINEKQNKTKQNKTNKWGKEKKRRKESLSLCEQKLKLLN